MLARPRTLPTGFIAPCLPTKTDKLPSGGLWLPGGGLTVELDLPAFVVLGEDREFDTPQ